MTAVHGADRTAYWRGEAERNAQRWCEVAAFLRRSPLGNLLARTGGPIGRGHPFEAWLFDKVGDRSYGGWSSVPADHLSYEFGPPDSSTGRPLYVARTSNDAFDLLLGYPSQWRLSLRRGDAQRLAVWVLWHWWARVEWLGARRWLWYRLLRRRIERTTAASRRGLGNVQANTRGTRGPIVTTS